MKEIVVDNSREAVYERSDYPLEKIRSILKDETVAVLGYGVQGRGQSLNMRDNGIPTDALESGRRKILVVDDDQDLVELITDVLERDGRFETRSVNNGFDAGMMVKDYRPDLIVLDVMLPDINGKEVCQRVRSDSTMDEVRIICISGMCEPDKIEDLKASGANEFLQKPFEAEMLVDRICGLLDIESVTAGS